MTIMVQTFPLRDNRELQQVPFEWEDEQPARYAKVVKKLNAQANTVESAFRTFVEATRARPNIAKDTMALIETESTKAAPAPTLGIITALPFEFAAFRELMADREVVTLGGTGAGRRITMGTIPARDGEHHRVALALADVGNNLAAARASRLLDRYPYLPLVMLGIAAGIPNPAKAEAHPRLGDVVVSDRGGVIQFDFQKQTGVEIEHRHAPRPPDAVLLDAVRHFEADRIGAPHAWAAGIADLVGRLQTSRPPEDTDVLLDPDSGNQIDHPHDPRRLSGVPRILFGPIASSNTLLKDASRRDLLREKFGVLAVEMEASGIADATWQHSSGYLVVRGISDYSDRLKGDVWQHYAAAAAALYLYELLRATPPL